MIRMFFGTPGCGKTTLAVRNLAKDRDHLHTFCNFECTHPLISDNFNPTDLGKWTPPEGSLVAIDEASCEWNSRSFKSFPPELIEYFKQHRHFRVDFDLYSQGFDDTDKVIRTLVEELWYGYKLPFGITAWRRLYKTVDIERHTDKSKVGQIIDGYRKASILSIFNPKNWQFCYRWHWYGFFNSWERKVLRVRYADSVVRSIRRKPWVKLLQDYYIGFHRWLELQKVKLYCFRYGVDLNPG